LRTLESFDAGSATCFVSDRSARDRNGETDPQATVRGSGKHPVNVPFSGGAPSASTGQVHLAALNRWLRNAPGKAELMGPAVSLRDLPLHKSDRQWVVEAIRMTKGYDADVEAMLRGV
jgi:hypothetical protein